MRFMQKLQDVTGELDYWIDESCGKFELWVVDVGPDGTAYTYETSKPGGTIGLDELPDHGRKAGRK